MLAFIYILSFGLIVLLASNYKLHSMYNFFIDGFVINLMTPDNNEEYVLELSNATLTNIMGFQAKDADLTVTIDRDDLVQTMMGAVSFDDQIKSGKAKLVGDRKPYDQLKTMLVQFDMGFEILPGTGAKDLTPKNKPFAHEPPAIDALTD